MTTRPELDTLSTDDLLTLLPPGVALLKDETGAWWAMDGKRLLLRHHTQSCANPRRYLIEFLIYCQERHIELNTLPYLLRLAAQTPTP